MLQALITSVFAIIVVFGFNAFIGRVTGVDSEEQAAKMGEAVMVVFVLYLVLTALFGSNIQAVGVPFVDKLEQYPGLLSFFQADLGGFVIECASLISLVFVINLVSQFIPSSFGGGTFAGQAVRSIALVMIGLGVNHYLLEAVSGVPLFQWALTVLQCFLSGAAILITPAMVIGKMLGVSSDSGIVSFLVKKLPETKLGKALSSAATNSLLIVFVIMLIESQFGGISGMVAGLPAIINMVAVIGMMLIGYRILFKSMFK